jgi:hypothetical protein
MTTNTYRREGNIIYFANTIGAPVKVAVINSKGYLQPAKGMADHRAALEAFLESDRIPEEEIEVEAAAKTVFPAPIDLQSPPRSPSAVTSDIPPCPPEDPAAGDKTPAVIAWWHRYHPEEAAARYKGRRFTMPEGL